ncbi:MAG: amidohydrolase family protein [Phycisphaerae bacterium]|jgi:predicted TIM-barrel fold metal-dependent hydrolase
MRSRAYAAGLFGALVSALIQPALAAPPGEDAEDIRELKLKDWQPRSMLKVKTTRVDKPAFPVFDVHNHLRRGLESKESVARMLAEMDAAGVRTVVHLDGMWGDELKRALDLLDNAHPGRFCTFARINFTGIDDPDWGERTARQLEESFQAGAKGLKFHKDLGLGVRYKDGRLMRVDDPKLNGVWQVCAKHNKPIVIHTSDPAAFFTPLDRYNERWHELNQHPDWLFADRSRFPTREELREQFTRTIAANPRTTFIGAHVASEAEDLALVSAWLDKYPNLYVDVCARINELGRQPYTARRFLIKYQDRVLFGTDTFPRREAFRIYYRFFETDDEYFDSRESHHLQGFWMIYGVYLPRDVLEKIYWKNAERLVLNLSAAGR